MCFAYITKYKAQARTNPRLFARNESKDIYWNENQSRVLFWDVLMNVYVCLCNYVVKFVGQIICENSK